jgi:hypothetical protein
MAVIGVDSSGKAGQPPIFMISVRQKEYRCIHLSPVAEHVYRNQAHWKYKLTAALIFKAVEPIFTKGDSVEIDEDFVGRSKLIEKYLTRLFVTLKGEKPRIYFSRRLSSKHVEKADVLTKLAKKGLLTIHESNPNLREYFKILGP